MDVETAIRTRRTHKQYGPEPVDRDTVEELLDLARFAPNHHLTQPWRFRVLGSETLARLQAAAGEKEAAKLERAPTLVLATAKLTGEPQTDEEDLHATAAAVYAVLVAAHARGLATYWRTPAAFDLADCRATVGLGDDERVVALIHLGTPVSEPAAKPREPLASYVQFLP